MYVCSKHTLYLFHYVTRRSPISSFAFRFQILVIILFCKILVFFYRFSIGLIKHKKLLVPVLRIFFKILVMGANFGDFGILISTSKFWKKFVRIVRQYSDQFWKILTFEFGRNRKVMINHRGGILFFCQILLKFKILDFRVKDLKFGDFVKFWVITNFVNFGKIVFKFVTKIIKMQNICVQIGNFCVRVKDFKFWNFRVKDFKFWNFRVKDFKFAKIQILQKSPNFVQKILNITNFAGFRYKKYTDTKISICAGMQPL